MAIDLAKHVADYLRRSYRLDGVPLPVIEEVLRQGIARIAEIMPAECEACELDAMEFEGCESCAQLIDPAHPDGAVVDGDGIWVCAACRVDGGPDASPGQGRP